MVRLLLYADTKNSPDAIIVMFIDLDEDKKINDEYGHDFGDQILLCFGQLLKQTASRRRHYCPLWWR
ncbi:diguanylate cyclase [Legionella pneumophila serogroup 5]|nr:diguanylate cyclase [Legionella pneumophila subsp. fraseri]MDW9034731.1 diguanylate cyclase [Legionella pneumophila subsp. fraseri]MDW9040852.1 diguanylate cyclase [Legionella pneumophila subsp. fraseri]MDW9062403.1 diguanylate cyclase [Legionella pneumophila subsp. fraseri]MDX1845072.1 diguanylate cyclase [Legionella pneumophila subsp. fraseri]